MSATIYKDLWLAVGRESHMFAHLDPQPKLSPPIGAPLGHAYGTYVQPDEEPEGEPFEPEHTLPIVEPEERESGLTGEHDVVLDAIERECLHQ